MDNTLIQKALRVNIIEMLGLQSLPEERKLELVDTLTEVVGAKVMARIEEELSAEDQAAFEKALDTGTGKQIAAWLREKGVDVEEMAVEEVAKIKDDLLARADAVA